MLNQYVCFRLRYRNNDRHCVTTISNLLESDAFSPRPAERSECQQRLTGPAGPSVSTSQTAERREEAAQRPELVIPSSCVVTLLIWIHLVA